MNVLITGASGQLGRALVASAPTTAHVIARSHAQLDISDADAVDRAFDSAQPDVVINAAAYTDVDAAETEPAMAMACNADGVRQVAVACERAGARLVHVSTDFVFDGQKSRPYLPDDSPAPLNRYGISKHEGEKLAVTALGDQVCIVRTSWLYSSGGSSFVTRVLRMVREHDQLRFVSDQVGAPTWVGSLAPALWRAAHIKLPGVHHWCDSGVASRYDFAVAIAEEAMAVGLLSAMTEIVPISSEEYPSRVRRPNYSVLDKGATEVALGMRASHWRESLRRMLHAMAGRD
jgi:dTDP-4-dehydrorhamnose reductase